MRVPEECGGAGTENVAQRLERTARPKNSGPVEKPISRKKKSQHLEFKEILAKKPVQKIE